MHDPVLRMTLALLLGWVMAEAGWHKLGAPLRFVGVIDAYRLLPEGAGARVARPLGGLELVLAVLLLVPFAQPAAALGTATLLTLYFVAMAVNLARGRRDIDCGCGGTSQTLSPGLLVRNAALVACCTVLVADATPARATGWADVLVALFAAAAAILLYSSANLLLATHQRMVRE